MSTPRFLPVDWPAPANVRAVCTLRDGGVSTGPYGSLNLAGHVGDDAQAVATNRARLKSHLSLPHEPLWLSQVHGTRVIDADRMVSSDVSATPEADAAITRSHGRVLAVMVADCMPILLCRRDGSGVAVAHAGWRGLAAGIVEAAVGGLADDADQVIAWLGPAIGPDHFEVGSEVRDAFCAGNPRSAVAFTPNARGRWQCDLHRLAVQRLEGSGVRCIGGQRRCTYRESESFFSYRRDGRTGRFAALLWMQGHVA
jgi:YfiH family protein